MTSRSGRSGNTLLNARNVIGFAFIALCSAPAFASSGIGASSSENPDAASTDTLAAELDGHGIARSDIIQAGMSASLNSPDTEITSLEAPHGLDLKPRGEIIIQAIFENSSGSSPSGAELIPADNAEIAPLASSADTVQPNADNLPDQVTTKVGTESSDAEMRLPGIDDADLLRFRRQMYRTDI